MQILEIIILFQHSSISMQYTSFSYTNNDANVRNNHIFFQQNIIDKTTIKFYALPFKANHTRSGVAVSMHA